MAAAPLVLERAGAGNVVVTAGRRLARTLRFEYAARAWARGRQVWPTPAVLPWEAWIESLWEAALYSGSVLPARLDEDQELLVWQCVLEESPEAAELLDLPAIAQAARDGWRLMHAWRIDRRAVEAQAGEDTRAFLGWASRFEHRSESEGWLEAARRPDYLAARLSAIRLPAAVTLAGFDELTPQQAAFLEACGRAGVEIEILQTPAAPRGKAVRVAFPDRAQELEAAARWARGLIERGEARTVGVVLPDLERVRGQLEEIFTRILEPEALLPGAPRRRRCFNISAAPPLAAAPVVRAALLALELDRARNPIARTGALLRSPFLAGADSERMPRALLDRQLREWGVWEVSVLDLRRRCRDPRRPCPVLRRALRNWSQLDSSLPERQRPGAWSRDFSRLLEKLGWPGERPLSSDEHQAVAAWRELLERLARLDAVAERISRSEALGLLRRMAALTPHQPESEPAPIQVLGVLEAAGLRFDALWIAGLDDETWPRPPRPDPFLPLALQRTRGLPHASPERELEFARRATERLLASALRVVASRPLRAEDRELGPSPLIREWPEVRVEDLGSPEGPDYLRMQAAARRSESFEDPRGPALGPEAWSRGGSRVFQYQALCPFRAFAELRLGAKAPEFPEAGLPPQDRGLAVHAALEHFWGEVESQQRLCELSGQELAEALERAAQAALARLEQRRGKLPDRFAELERRRLVGLLEAWLNLERERPPFRVVRREWARRIELAGIRAEVKIDRVDRLEDGRELILDYKTGRCSEKDWEGERPEDPQLPLYAVTYEGTPAGLAFARLKRGKMGFRGLAEGCQPAPGMESGDLAARLAEWRAALERLAGQFREGRAEVDPKRGDQTCRTCGLWPLCRVHQAELPLAEEEEDEAV